MKSDDLHEEDDGALFVEETFGDNFPLSNEQADASGSNSKLNQIKKRRQTPSLKEKTASMEVGLQRLLGTKRRDTEPTNQTEGSSNQRVSRQKTNRLSAEELESIWSPSSIIASAKENAALPEIPTFTNTDKSKALNELIASLPDLSPEDQAAAKSDRQRILEATRKFDHKPSSDGAGGWKVKGLKTSLSHHQVRRAMFNPTMNL